jgi:hypothetical protein
MSKGKDLSWRTSQVDALMKTSRGMQQERERSMRGGKREWSRRI